MYIFQYYHHLIILRCVRELTTLLLSTQLLLAVEMFKLINNFTASLLLLQKKEIGPALKFLLIIKNTALVFPILKVFQDIK